MITTVTWASSTETQSRRSVYGETIDELLELTDYEPTPDEVHYAHADKLGSIMLMVTSGGAIEESYRYKEYGETTVVDDSFAKLGNLGSNINNWKRYTGRERMIGGSVSDPWYHYRARAYRADAGRFVQQDPLTYHEGANAYTYVGVSPLNQTDPLGLFSVGGGFPPGHCPGCGFPHPDGVPRGQVAPPAPIGPVGYSGCLNAPPTSGGCDAYGRGDTLDGVSLHCMCECMGDSPWENKVRGCLQCFHEQGMEPYTSHLACYFAAGVPDGTTLLALMICVDECAVE